MKNDLSKIYILFENEENGKLVNPIAMEWNGHVFDLNQMTTNEAVNKIQELYPDIFKDFHNGKVTITPCDMASRFANIQDEKEKNKVIDDIDEAIQNKINKDMEARAFADQDSIIDETKQDTKSKKVKGITKENKKSGKGKGIIAGALVALAILGAAYGVHKYKSKANLEHDSITSQVKTPTEESLTNLEVGIENFNKLASKYNVNNKQLGIKAEEWLSAYLYANSYDYTIQELTSILKDNPNFLSEMANNYRTWCKVQYEYNIIADETSLTKEFFKNEKAYEIYMNYYNLFKKAQAEPTKENKLALENLTKELYGLSESKDGINSIDETYPGLASIIGYTLTTGARKLDLITQTTYDNCMGVSKTDAKGNKIETRGPIEIATCERIEIEKFDKIVAIITTEEDKLNLTFVELNKAYNVLKENNKLLTEEEVLKKINEINNAVHNKYSTKNDANSNQASKPTTKKITEEEAQKDFTQKEIDAAEDKADKSFEQEYATKIAQQEAKAAGLIDTNEKIETILGNARLSIASAYSYTEQSIIDIGTKLKKTYRGNYQSFYKEGIEEAVESGIKELLNIQKLWKKANENSSSSSETIETIPQDQYDKETNNSSSQPTTENSSGSSSDINNNDNQETTVTTEEYISQEELDKLVSSSSVAGLTAVQGLTLLKDKILDLVNKKRKIRVRK